MEDGVILNNAVIRGTFWRGKKKKKVYNVFGKLKSLLNFAPR